MATKQEKAVKSAVTREKKRGIMREEKHVLWFLIVIILFLLYLLFAQHKGWWPYASPKLGTAFYTNLSAQTPVDSATEESSQANDDTNNTSNTNSGGTDTSGGNTDTGNGGGSGNGSGGNNGGGSSTTPTDTSSILDLAAGINVGDTKTSVSGQANGLNEHCAVVVGAAAQTAGKQEVCTYSEGDKIVTVTYLNDRVISASKSGF